MPQTLLAILISLSLQLASAPPPAAAELPGVLILTKTYTENNARSPYAKPFESAATPSK